MGIAVQITSRHDPLPSALHPTPALCDVQEQLPDAKVLYSSATGASEPKNLGGCAFMVCVPSGMAGLAYGVRTSTCRCPANSHANACPSPLLMAAGYMTRLGLWGAKDAVEFINILNK